VSSSITPSQGASSEALFISVSGLGHRLMELLEAEFDALKSQNLDQFEALQSEKIELLNQLAAQADPIRSASEHAAPDSPWQEFNLLIRQCSDAHRRNETLMSRQLAAIKGALQALIPLDASQSVEVYDRMGQLSRRTPRGGVNEA